MKNNSLIIGGILAMIEAVLYIFGFMVLLLVFQPTIDEAKSGLDKLKYIIHNKAIYQAWIILIYVVFGLMLVPLTVTISENFKKQTTIWTKITPVFGFIWSALVIASGMIGVIGLEAVEKILLSDPNAALTSWETVEIIQNGIGGDVEIIGGLWVFLISITSLKEATFNTYLNYFGLIVGGAGILTIFPPHKDLGGVFGLTQIVWFIVIGIAMIKKGLNR